MNLNLVTDQFIDNYKLMLLELKQIQSELLEHDNADAELASRLFNTITQASKGVVL